MSFNVTFSIYLNNNENVAGMKLIDNVSRITLRLSDSTRSEVQSIVNNKRWNYEIKELFYKHPVVSTDLSDIGSNSFQNIYVI